MPDNAGIFTIEVRDTAGAGSPSAPPSEPPPSGPSPLEVRPGQPPMPVMLASPLPVPVYLATPGTKQVPNIPEKPGAGPLEVEPGMFEELLRKANAPPQQPNGTAPQATSGPWDVNIVGPLPVPVTIVGGQNPPGGARPNPPPSPNPRNPGAAAPNIPQVLLDLIKLPFAQLIPVIGPVAIGLGILELASRAVAKSLNEYSAVIRAVGHQAAAVASNDGLGAVVIGAENTARALDQIPIVGQAFAATLRTGTAGIQAFEESMNAFVRRAGELARFSGEISAAQAQAQIRTLQADINEAQTLGPAMYDLIMAQNEMNMEFRELLLPIKQAVIPILTEMARSVSDLLEVANLLINMPGVKESASLVSSALAVELAPLHTIAAIARWFQGKEQKKDSDVEAPKIIDKLLHRTANVMNPNVISPPGQKGLPWMGAQGNQPVGVPHAGTLPAGTTLGAAVGMF